MPIYYKGNKTSRIYDTKGEVALNYDVEGGLNKIDDGGGTYNIDLKDIEIVDEELYVVSFNTSDFTRTRFVNCELRKCFIEKSKLDGTEFLDTDMGTLRILHSSINNAYIGPGCFLASPQGSNFFDCTMQKTDFEGIKKISSIVMFNTNLYKVGFYDMDNITVTFNGARFTKGTLENMEDVGFDFTGEFKNIEVNNVHFSKLRFSYGLNGFTWKNCSAENVNLDFLDYKKWRKGLIDISSFSSKLPPYKQAYIDGKRVE